MMRQVSQTPYLYSRVQGCDPGQHFMSQMTWWRHVASHQDVTPIDLVIYLLQQCFV